MGSETIYQKLILWLWMKLTRAMLSAGFGKAWLMGRIDEQQWFLAERRWKTVPFPTTTKGSSRG